jgi:sodium transport system ATP-binding protein
MIQVRQLRKSFDGVEAVRNLSFDAPDGAITGLLGPNGAGKTTTLRMLTGVLRPSSGTIRIGGSSFHEDAAGARQRLGALLDDHGLYARLTAREHLVYFGRLRGLARESMADRAGQVLSTLGLTALADRRVGGFSQGERMKVSLGCALIHEPGHVLLDEPTNGLDVPSVRALRQVLKRLRDRGSCIIFSSHVLSEVEELCDRVVVLAGGTVTAQGTLNDVREQTRSETLEDAFVALTSAGETKP